MTCAVRMFSFAVAALAAVGCRSVDPVQPPVFGSEWPGVVPELIAPGVINTDGVEINLVFRRDYSELFFARMVDGLFCIFTARRGPDGWQAPERLELMPHDRTAQAVDMSLSTDGDALYFLGITQVGGQPQCDLYVSRRHATGWAPAQPVPAPVSTEHLESYPVVTADGSLWFVSNRPGTRGVNDLYRASPLAGGGFSTPVAIGPPIDGSWRKGDTAVSPDQSIVVTNGTRPDGQGGGDLCISFRLPDGSYSEPRNMGPSFNSPWTDFCPMFSPDGRWFSFSRRHGESWAAATDAEIFWVDARALEQFRPR